MFRRLRSQLPVLIVAVLVSTVFATGPMVAHAAFDAINSDKVDGKHAVSAAATLTNRKGKLVATSATTGRLPNNIIAKAPDADRLDGKDSSAFSLTGHDHDADYVESGTATAVAVMAIRGDASVRHQTDPAATVTRISAGVYCIVAPGAQEGTVGVLQNAGGATEGTIRVSMGIGNSCSSPVPGTNIVVETFTGTTPSDQRFAVMYPVALN